MRLGIITNPKHRIIVALNKKGYYHIELYYGSKCSQSWGWEIQGELNIWIGYTIKSALCKINSLQNKFF